MTVALLSTADLTAMRAVVADSSPETATIQRPSNAADGAGGQTRTWNSVATGVACRVTPVMARPSERGETGRLQSSSEWEITLPYNQDVRALDRVVVGTRTYEVVAPLARRSYEVRTRVRAVQVQ